MPELTLEETIKRLEKVFKGFEQSRHRRKEVAWQEKTKGENQMTKSNIWHDNYKDIVEHLHELAEDDAFAGYGDSKAKLLLHIINEIELKGHNTQTFEDFLTLHEISNLMEDLKEDLENKIETLEERIKKLEAKL